MTSGPEEQSIYYIALWLRRLQGLQRAGSSAWPFPGSLPQECLGCGEQVTVRKQVALSAWLRTSKNDLNKHVFSSCILGPGQLLGGKILKRKEKEKGTKEALPECFFCLG